MNLIPKILSVCVILCSGFVVHAQMLDFDLFRNQQKNLTDSENVETDIEIYLEMVKCTIDNFDELRSIRVDPIVIVQDFCPPDQYEVFAKFENEFPRELGGTEAKVSTVSFIVRNEKFQCLLEKIVALDEEDLPVYVGNMLEKC